MNVEVDIYMSGLIKFFNNNPQDLLNLIPGNRKDEFFKQIREVASTNVEEGKDPALTQKQILEICVILNTKEIQPVKDMFFDERIFKPSPFGTICLN